jgi:hypothetical protein
VRQNHHPGTGKGKLKKIGTSMEWNYRKWSNRKRLIGLLIIFILSIFFFASRAHAEETIGGHIKEAVIDTLTATAAIVGAAEQSMTGNFVTGAILTTLAGNEIVKAYGEIRCAWDLYRSYDDPNRNDRDISPAESMMEHGRD